MTPRHLLEPARLAGGALLRAQSDARLVDMARAGNDRAFEAIVARHKGDLLRYCSRILRDGRSEDAVQQVFVNAYRALHADTTPLTLRSWLFGIAHNVSLNVLRQRGVDHEPLEAFAGVEEAAHVTVERKERLREVLGAVAALPRGQRDAIVLRELEGRGHDEIARELGVTGGAARQLISRARNGVRSAAAAMLPMPLLMRMTSGMASEPTTERLAELTAVGGGITVTKVVATGAVGATLLGGAVTGPDLIEGDKDRRGADVAEAAEPEADDAPGDEQAMGNGQRTTSDSRPATTPGSAAPVRAPATTWSATMTTTARDPARVTTTTSRTTTTTTTRAPAPSMTTRTTPGRAPWTTTELGSTTPAPAPSMTARTTPGRAAAIPTRARYSSPMTTRRAAEAATAARRSTTPGPAARAERVLARVRATPPGFVRTYGDVSPGAPRFAGTVLHRCDDPTVPWQRIVRADGSLAKGERQRKLLEAEGIPFKGNRVDLRVARLPDLL